MEHFGLLLLRLIAGGTMLLAHGLQKFNGYTGLLERFPDLTGLGVQVSLSLAIFAELFCAGLVVLGLFTRLATIPLIITMSVAFFIVHSADPFQNKELALIYLSIFSCLLFTGPGKFSVQEIFKISAGRFGWLLK